MEAKMLPLLLLATLGPGPAAGSHHGRPMPGSPYDISKNSAAVQQAVLGAAHSFNSQSNDAFLFKPSAVLRAQRQVVRGIRYIVDFQISRTVCPKRNRTSDLDRCRLQPPGRLAQTFRCHLELWLIPWKPGRETLELLCRSHQQGPVLIQTGSDQDPVLFV
ncbi:cystatin-F [Poecilia reticulata]|uniref:cystatin-F n=1 Tax=Poecilia reticulata TaxID=8081 RepID=UPI0004A2AAA9|nr:PREDICTED: cystatin-F [Poecilia reticulata]XP_008428757.1 PREDICTED: cystatin-F [Poecilia reticulata]XP_008428758.1 PREDICTED: cystatin-F [Poecilia reticulata]XP_008428760.1 PREDICTED: cystatin-F [Poecilia reticulata]XP_017164429.1 PREDICTED: cystatin-F [Poecilia reticulata]